MPEEAAVAGPEPEKVRPRRGGGRDAPPTQDLGRPVPQLAELVREILVEQVADLLGWKPDGIDPAS